MSCFSEEELDELLRRQVMRQPKNFEERRLFAMENQREFREKFHLPVDAFGIIPHICTAHPFCA